MGVFSFLCFDIVVRVCVCVFFFGDNDQKKKKRESKAGIESSQQDRSMGEGEEKGFNRCTVVLQFEVDNNHSLEKKRKSCHIAPGPIDR